MALLNASQTAAEIKRKATAGIALTNTSNAANNAAYKAAIPAVKTTQDAVPTATASKVTTPVMTPKVSTTAAVTTPTANISAEIQRKAAAGIPLTNTANAANNAAYKAAVPQMKASVPTVTTPAAVTTPTTAPTTSYVANGGQTLNDILYLKKQYESGKTGAAQYATPAYAKLDPTLAANVKGMNSTQLEQYIMSQNSQGTGQGVTVPEETAAETMPATDYRALAQAAYEQQQAQYDASAAANVKELERRNDYSVGVTQDNRTLQDASFYRNNTPTAWDGSTGYQMADTNRNRSVEDTYTAQGLTDAEAAAYSAANTFRDQSANFVSTKASELESAAQQYNLQVAGLTGTLNGQQTMAGASNAASTAGQVLSNASQAISNQIAQIDLANYPKETALKIQQLQQQVTAGSISNDTAAYQLTQLSDPNSASNQAAALDLQMKQIDASNYSAVQKAQLEQLQKTVAEIGKTPYVSDTDKQLDQLKVQQATLELKKLQEGETTAGMTAEEYATTYLDKSVQRNDKDAITNLDAIQAQILQSGLPDAEMAKLYSRYGIPLPDGYSGN